MAEYTRRATLKGIGAVGAALAGAGCTAVNVDTNEDPQEIEADIREEYSSFTEIQRDSIDVQVAERERIDEDRTAYGVTATARLQDGGRDICSYSTEERYALADRLETDALRIFNGLYDHYGGNSEDADDRENLTDVVELYTIRFEDETGAALVEVTDGTAERIARGDDSFDLDGYDHVANFKQHFRTHLTTEC